ncbi:flagellar biosynthesis protein FlhA [Pseudomonas putida]|uniref:Flagellar biosynthesis protein FlhA n=1 Tax=Pseudomonas putida TaxID=303 RepID=A0A8I1JIH3_PSEPU|nr:flagellar biosynthesis protein FlhA [Pseudomonas putida]MBI6882519.1 flagellar biosynthesis protein FlhA [Pseudomonas putida]
MKALNNLMGPSSLLLKADAKMLAGPVLILMILSMMVIPLPTIVLDVLFTFNIAIALMVLLASMFTRRALEFAAFPSILLFTTLLRLSLNVASTRVVLMHGHEGAGAAGQVIEAFSHFVVGGNFAVGVVVFAILVIINFMVITKGAGRIAEVGARFTLDSMPGKQMAIDADLNAGLIAEDEAKRRRKEVAQESEFYGSMDGASKFVRGDAMAGILIMFVTMFGGLMIGMLQHKLPFGQAIETYVLLTIGDGLVAQIPALIISIAAGVIVSRVNTDEDVGEQLTGQLFAKPRVLFLAAGVLGLLGIIPGMPNYIFLPFASLLAVLGWFILTQQTKKLEDAILNVPPSAATAEAPEASWDDVKRVETLSIEVGHRLIPLVDQRQDGGLLTRIKSVRKKFTEDYGFLPPPVYIADNLQLEQHAYVISLRGVEIARGELYPDKDLAIDSGGVSGKMEGIETTDPAFGLPAIWIDSSQRELAQVYGYTVVDASTVAATYLNELLQRHASALIGRPEVQKLLDTLGEEHKPLIDEVVPKLVSLTTLLKILQALLEESVSIRDIRTILETLAEHADGQNTDVDTLTGIVRVSLGRAITQQWFGVGETIAIIGLDAHLEQVLIQALNSGGAIEPNLAANIFRQAEAALLHQEENDLAPVLVVVHPLRSVMSRLLRKRLRNIAVLSLNEIPDDRDIRITSSIGASN